MPPTQEDFSVAGCVVLLQLLSLREESIRQEQQVAGDGDVVLRAGTQHLGHGLRLLRVLDVEDAEAVVVAGEGVLPALEGQVRVVPDSASLGMLARCSMLSEWTISSWPGISPLSMASRTSARALLDTSVDASGPSPGSGVATAPAVSSADKSPAAAAATPKASAPRSRVVEQGHCFPLRPFPSERFTHPRSIVFTMHISTGGQQTRDEVFDQ